MVTEMYQQIREEAKRDTAKWNNPGDVDRGYKCACCRACSIAALCCTKATACEKSMLPRQTGLCIDVSALLNNHDAAVPTCHIVRVLR